jgi:hypothetical protein
MDRVFSAILARHFRLLRAAVTAAPRILASATGVPEARPVSPSGPFKDTSGCRSLSGRGCRAEP